MFGFNPKLRISAPLEETKMLGKDRRDRAIKAAGWGKKTPCWLQGMWQRGQRWEELWIQNTV